MCKIACFAGINNQSRKNAWKFVIASRPHLTKNDNDGFGYAVSSGTDLFGERWTDVSKAFLTRTRSPHDELLVRSLGDAISAIPSDYNSFGRPHFRKGNAFLLHARMATCGKELTNVHPFVSKDGQTALIHNGVISNHYHADLRKRTSTCDSEVILNRYTDFKVSEHTKNLEHALSPINGYFACGVLTKDKSGTRVMDIFKCDDAELWCAFVKELNTTVFFTEKRIIYQTLKDLKWEKPTECFEVNGGHLIRINAVTGQVMSLTPFEIPDRLSAVSNYNQWDKYRAEGYPDDGPLSVTGK